MRVRNKNRNTGALLIRGFLTRNSDSPSFRYFRKYRQFLLPNSNRLRNYQAPRQDLARRRFRSCRRPSPMCNIGDD